MTRKEAIENIKDAECMLQTFNDELFIGEYYSNSKYHWSFYKAIQALRALDDFMEHLETLKRFNGTLKASYAIDFLNRYFDED